MDGKFARDFARRPRVALEKLGASVTLSWTSIVEERPVVSAFRSRRADVSVSGRPRITA